MAISESTFPTIADLQSRLNDLIEKGFSELPVQMLIVPDSTLQAIARSMGQVDDNKPALMIDMFDESGNSVLIASMDRWSDSGPMNTKRSAVQ